jgi:hypothetical protein
MQLDQVNYGVKREAFGPIYLVTWHWRFRCWLLSASSFRCHGNRLGCQPKRKHVEQSIVLLIEPKIFLLPILDQPCFTFWLLPTGVCSVLLFHSAGKLGWPCSLCLLSCDKYSHVTCQPALYWTALPL